MNLLDFYIPEWFFVALNLTVLVVALRKLLWKPVTQIMEARQEKVAQMMRSAEEAEERAKEIEARFAQQEAELETMTREKMREARERAGREYDRIVAEAGDKAAIIIAGAETRARQDQVRIMRESREQMMDIILRATAALIAEKMDGEANRRLVQAILEKEEVA
ncbi:MAG: ATP synthase F0 subunit B [Peptococcaceae bacterium]|jgi:F-type H+-transporting ATPase subunit b|nr:ATP synthase F0 subunit B [Peptococcaceae bacterium]